MARGVSAAVESAVQGDHVHCVYMVNLQFDTPVYAHSGFGVINFESNDYLGVGDFGSVTGVEESEGLAPTPIRLQLTGVDAQFLAEAFDATEYGSRCTLYKAFRNDDGSLVGSPEIIFKGEVENADVIQGEENSIALVVQHALKTISDKNGARYSDAYQQATFAGDLAFEYIAEMADLRLTWGSGGGGNGPMGGFGRPPGVQPVLPIPGSDPARDDATVT